MRGSSAGAQGRVQAVGRVSSREGARSNSGRCTRRQLRQLGHSRQRKRLLGQQHTCCAAMSSAGEKSGSSCSPLKSSSLDFSCTSRRRVWACRGWCCWSRACSMRGCKPEPCSGRTRRASTNRPGKARPAATMRPTAASICFGSPQQAGSLDSIDSVHPPNPPTESTHLLQHVPHEAARALPRVGRRRRRRHAAAAVLALVRRRHVLRLAAAAPQRGRGGLCGRLPWLARLPGFACGGPTLQPRRPSGGTAGRGGRPAGGAASGGAGDRCGSRCGGGAAVGAQRRQRIRLREEGGQRASQAVSMAPASALPLLKTRHATSKPTAAPRGAPLSSLCGKRTSDRLFSSGSRSV